ncbi:DUF1178 family protein [Paracidovorax konjaci]|uniref:Uncharacterized protein n=1 Tax=Paracidovorax konjaci TaxID=32040 RepID=A0A1I1RYT3_9BURK|nr:DUF1178 family protein [Paracidovorax konjaci]SFD37468.1 hypothetical protein SAMN04489710_101363 [Paracidovorax konjaci]
MKVLDLHCAHDHTFEGWFGSESDFQDQLARGLVECPLCGSRTVRKALSAPRLNLRAGSAPPPATAASEAAPSSSGGSASASASASASPAPAGSGMAPSSRALQAAWLQMARHVMAHTEDVGRGFAQEARRIHHGEAEERPIRGQASPKETAQLLDEGIAVLPLPLPVAAKETLQ